MRKAQKSVVILTTAFAFLAAPVAMDVAGLHLGTSLAYAAGKGNSDHGKGNGNSGDHGNSGSGSGGNASGNHSKSSASGSPGTESDVSQPETKKVSAAANGGLNAKLAGLHSLNRNINGIKNSSDPRMAGIRSYLEAHDTLDRAEADLVAAKGKLTDAQDAYNALATSLGVDGYADTSLAGLSAQLASVEEQLVLDAENPDLLAEAATLTNAIDTISASAELAALAGAQDEIASLDATIAEATAASSDAALADALVAAANKNRIAQYGDSYVDDEMLNWAKSRLGV